MTGIKILVVSGLFIVRCNYSINGCNCDFHPCGAWEGQYPPVFAQLLPDNISMEKTIRKFDSFADQDRYEVDYWKSVEPDKKLEVLESIRELYMELNGEGQQGFQRVLRVIEQA